ncbi:MAG: DUF4836 family protein [Salibacteraceae bacterium]
MSQKLVQQIPVEANMVVMIDGERLAEKGQIARTAELSFMKELDSGLSGFRQAFRLNKSVVTTFLKDPAEYGLDLKSKSFFYIEENDSIKAYSVLLSMADEARFSAWLQSAVLPDYWEAPTQNNDEKSLVLGQFGLRWNANRLMVSWLEMSDAYFSEHYGGGFSFDLSAMLMERLQTDGSGVENDTLSLDSLEMARLEAEKPELLKTIEAEKSAEEKSAEDEEEAEELSYSEKRELKSKMENEWLKARLVRPIEVSKQSSLLSNDQFLKAQKAKVDIGWWMKFEQESPATSLGAMAFSYPMLYSFLKDMRAGAPTQTSFLVFQNFEDDEVVLGMDVYLDRDTYKSYKKTYNNKIDKSFQKYLPADGTVAYYGASINIEALVEATRESFDPVLRLVPNYGKNMVDVLELADMVVDGDAMYDLWTGDVMLAWTGVKEFETTYISYDYDENFNQVEVVKTKTEKLPSFTALMSTEDDASWERMMKIGAATEVLKDMGGYFRVEEEDLELDFSLFIGVNDGVVIMTNDEDLLKYNLPDGLPKNQQMTKQQMAELRNGKAAMSLDIGGLLDLLPEFTPAAPDEKQLQLISMVQENFIRMRISSFSVKSRKIRVSAGLEMAEKEGNALFQALVFGNQMFEFFQN